MCEIGNFFTHLTLSGLRGNGKIISLVYSLWNFTNTFSHVQMLFRSKESLLSCAKQKPIYMVVFPRIESKLHIWGERNLDFGVWWQSDGICEPLWSFSPGWSLAKLCNHDPVSPRYNTFVFCFFLSSLAHICLSLVLLNRLNAFNDTKQLFFLFCFVFFPVVVFYTLLAFIQMTIWAKGRHRAYSREFKDYPSLRMAIIPLILWSERGCFFFLFWYGLKPIRNVKWLREGLIKPQSH